MLLRGLVLLFAVAVASSAKPDVAATTSLLLKKKPPYVPRQDMARVIKAVSSRFYESKTSDAGLLLESLRNPQTPKNAGEFAEGDDEPTCEELIWRATIDYYRGKSYALYMDDSHGKEESGAYQGNYMWLGRYYECQGLTDGENVVADMCLGILGDSPNSTSGLFIGFCFPNICTPEKLQEIYQPSLGNTTYLNVLCPGRDKTFDAVDITAIVIFSVLGFLLVVGTTYEIYLLSKARENNVDLRDKPVAARLLVSFSAIKNTKTLMSTSRKKGNISVLDGIRVLSMSWVILGHTINFVLGSVDNLSDIANYYITQGSALAIVNGTLAVDSFFFLSGLLVAYLGLKEYNKTHKLSVAEMYIHRYLRLTPPVALMMLFAVSLYQKIGSGLLYELRNEPLVPLCQKYWWTNLLYINNLYPANMEDECVGWCWYLANDMQFYLLSPIFILLLASRPKIGLGILGFLIVGSAAITGALNTHFELWPDVYWYGMLSRYAIYIFHPNKLDYLLELLGITDPAKNQRAEIPTAPPEETTGDSYWDDVYTKPWCRMGAYFIGMITGYILYSRKNIKMNKIFVGAMWIAVGAIECAVVYGVWGSIKEGPFLEPYDQDVMSFYEAVKRPVWALGLAWLTIACTYGYGGPITSILSFKSFIPLSRLTFCAYLLHPLVLFYLYTSREVEVHFRINIYIYYFLATIVLSFSCAYIFSLLIEMPVAEIQKVIFSRRARVQTNQNGSGIVSKVGDDGVIPNGNGVVPIENGVPPVYKKVGVVNKIELEEEEKEDPYATVKDTKGEYL